LIAGKAQTPAGYGILDAMDWSLVGKTKPAGDAGVIRIGAIGTKYTLGKCSTCGTFRWIAIERDPEQEAS